MDTGFVVGRGAVDVFALGPVVEVSCITMGDVAKTILQEHRSLEVSEVFFLFASVRLDTGLLIPIASRTAYSANRYRHRRDWVGVL